MKLLVGLGNPGEQYEKTRHNAGFMFVDFFRKRMDFPEFSLENDFKGLISEGNINGEKVILLKPLTFMNLSGESVIRTANFYKILSSDIFVIYDDVDLPLGSIRFREKGSAGTHNGMKSIINHLSTMDFPRLRLGIETRSKNNKISLDAYVLSNFTGKEVAIFKEELEDAFEKVQNALAK